MRISSLHSAPAAWIGGRRGAVHRAAPVFRSPPREPADIAPLNRAPGAICLVAAPSGLYIGSHYEPRSIHVEQYFQADE
jgi:hypothetical protein